MKDYNNFTPGSAHVMGNGIVTDENKYHNMPGDPP